MSEASHEHGIAAGRRFHRHHVAVSIFQDINKSSIGVLYPPPAVNDILCPSN